MHCQRSTGDSTINQRHQRKAALKTARGEKATAPRCTSQLARSRQSPEPLPLPSEYLPGNKHDPPHVHKRCSTFAQKDLSKVLKFRQIEAFNAPTASRTCFTTSGRRGYVYGRPAMPSTHKVARYHLPAGVNKWEKVREVYLKQLVSHATKLDSAFHSSPADNSHKNDA
ncbi:hypothetical protein Purlil1_13509 [Purpureocillium lilacinum]|uniref:Uncharacterized protein n=1 Tax=Purpureocillium lilacinum TaxID=33203 RepID=A0ABR0BDW4_PURLI|nr:hypothetical protein Purlil1_13509 [Purpureocillium lilacinum]